MRSMTLRKAKQKGFTLLELLVVVTLLAILATGALLAYEGLTDTAQGAAASNNTATADQSIRNFKAVTGNYPNQWDHLVAQDATGTDLAFVADQTYNFLAKVDASPLSAVINAAFLRVGVDEFQIRTASGIALTPGVEPNLQHNEGAVQVAGAPGSTIELDIGDGEFFNRLVIIPSVAEVANVPTTCTVGGNPIAATRTNPDVGTSITTLTPAEQAAFLNKINDAFEADECNLVAAFGFGNDAAKSTTGSAVAISSAPTYVSNVINPARNYARYIALFHLGRGQEGIADITANDIFRKPILVGVVDPEGKLIDQNIAVSNTTTQQ